MSVLISSIYFSPVKSLSFTNIKSCIIKKDLGIVNDRSFAFSRIIDTKKAFIIEKNPSERKLNNFLTLKNSKFLAGENYTIADIATWPWIARHEWHDIGLNNYESLKRWYVNISEREAVIKGFQFMNKNELPPQP